MSYLVMLVLFQFYCAKSCINNSVFGPCHSPLENVSVFGRVNRASEGIKGARKVQKNTSGKLSTERILRQGPQVPQGRPRENFRGTPAILGHLEKFSPGKNGSQVLQVLQTTIRNRLAKRISKKVDKYSCFFFKNSRNLNKNYKK